jgi:hypothetical protein
MLQAAAVVACALNLLGRSHAEAPIRLIPSAPGLSSAVEAFVVHDPPAIYLITSTSAFRDAQKGRVGLD